MNTITAGQYTISALTDYLGPYQPLAELFPTVRPEQWTPHRALYPEAFADGDAPDRATLWRAAFNCYLIRPSRSPADLTLVDTGAGQENDPIASPGALMRELAACGVAPEQISRVVFTHMHGDHIGWNLTPAGAPTFPQARYLFERGAWDALHAAAAGGNADAAQASAQLRRLEALGVVSHFTAGEAVAEGCVSLATDGHAPGHISVLVGSGAARALIVGDALLHPAQVAEPDWASIYDEDAAQARITRRRLLDLAEAERLLARRLTHPRRGLRARHPRGR